MLTLSQTLPPGALIGGEGAVLTKALGRSGGARFIAREEDLLRQDGKITGWREARGAVELATTEPNAGQSRFDPGPPGALLFEDGKHCGFVLSAYAPKVSPFTAAIIYRSAGAAKTLLSVSTGQSNNLIFLSEGEGRLLLKDRESTVEVSLPLSGSPDQARMAVIGFDGRGLSLECGGRKAEARGALPGLAHPADLFIGCRSNRPGLLKMLGTSRLHEVMFWPDRALLGSSEAESVAALAALNRYFRWTY